MEIFIMIKNVLLELTNVPDLQTSVNASCSKISFQFCHKPKRLWLVCEQAF
jgi:hypothetical protein